MSQWYNNPLNGDLSDLVNNTANNTANSEANTDPISRKMNEVPFNIEEKYRLMQENKKEKEREIKGLRKGKLVFNRDEYGKIDFDGDSGQLIDSETKELIPFRGTAYNIYDAGDLREDIYGSEKLGKPGSKYKRRVQPKIVSELTGKPVELLTDSDYENVDKYHTLQTLSFLKNPNAPFEKYDNNKFYSVPTDVYNEEIEVYYKTKGEKDIYGRYIADIFEPTTGKSVFERNVDNPYLNMPFNLKKAYGEKNAKRRENFLGVPYKEEQPTTSTSTPTPTPTPTPTVNTTNTVTPLNTPTDANTTVSTQPSTVKDIFAKHKINFDSLVNDYSEGQSAPSQVLDWLGGGVDAFQASIYEFMNRMPAEYLPEMLGGGEAGKRRHEALMIQGDDGLTGYERMAGMKPLTKEKFRKTLVENSKLFEEAAESIRLGRTDEGFSKLTQWGKNAAYLLPYTMGQSFGSMLPIALASIATGGAGSLLGLSGHIIGGIVGTLGWAAENTSQANEEYKLNNGGKEMPKEKFLEAFIANIPAAGMEMWLGSKFLKTIFGGTKAAKLFNKGSSTPIRTKPVGFLERTAKGVGYGAGFETIQEGWENALQNYYGQNEETARPFLEVATQPKTVEGALYGGIMGGVLGGVGGNLSGIAANNQIKKQSNNLNKHNKYIETHTIFNDKTANQNDIDHSNKVIAEVNNIVKDDIYTNSKYKGLSNSDFLTLESERIKKLRDLANEAITQKSWNVAQKAYAEAINNAINRINKDKKLAKDAKKQKLDELFKSTGLGPEEVFRKVSYYNSPLGLLEEGKTQTESQQKNTKKELAKLGESLGFAVADVQRMTEDVHNNIFNGPEGVYNLKNIADKYTDLYQEELKQPESEERNKRLEEYNQWRTGAIASLARLLAHEQVKMNDMISDVNELAKNPNIPSTVHRKWASGEGEHYAIRSDIVGGNQNHAKVFNNIKKDFSEIYDVIKDSLKDNESETATIQDIINSNERYADNQAFKIDLFASKEKTLKQFTNRYYEAVNNVQDQLDTNLIEAKRVIQTKSLAFKKLKDIANKHKSSEYYINELALYGRLNPTDWAFVKERYVKNPSPEMIKAIEKVDNRIKTRRWHYKKTGFRGDSNRTESRIKALNRTLGKDSIRNSIRLPENFDTDKSVRSKAITKQQRLLKILDKIAELGRSYKGKNKEIKTIVRKAGWYKKILRIHHARAIKRVADIGKPKTETKAKLKNSTPNFKATVGKEYVNHSGGAKGSDTEWGTIGSEYGVTSNHYYYGQKTHTGNVALTEEQFKEGLEHANAASDALGKPRTKTPYIQALFARNWFQVKNSDSVYAIALNWLKGKERKAVEGGTGYAVQMAITNNKPVYIFNQTDNKWYQYDYTGGEFKETDIPTLTKNFAGIGTRQLSPSGKQAIRNVYEKTFREAVANNTKKRNEEIAKNAKPLGTKEKPIVIYSDGSHIKDKPEMGYGAVFKIGSKEYSLSGTNESNSFKDLRKQFPDAGFSNPTMELLALTESLETVANLGIGEHVHIKQDYIGAINFGKLWEKSEGSEYRSSKPWEAKEPYIVYLIGKIEKAIESIEANGGSVKIEYVKGHSKDVMNDRADYFAKDRTIHNNFIEAYGQEDTEESTEDILKKYEIKDDKEKEESVEDIFKKYQIKDSEENEDGKKGTEKTKNPLRITSDRLLEYYTDDLFRTFKYKYEAENVANTLNNLISRFELESQIASEDKVEPSEDIKDYINKLKSLKDKVTSYKNNLTDKLPKDSTAKVHILDSIANKYVITRNNRTAGQFSAFEIPNDIIEAYKKEPSKVIVENEDITGSPFILKDMKDITGKEYVNKPFNIYGVININTKNATSSLAYDLDELASLRVNNPESFGFVNDKDAGSNEDSFDFSNCKTLEDCIKELTKVMSKYYTVYYSSVKDSKDNTKTNELRYPSISAANGHLSAVMKEDIFLRYLLDLERNKNGLPRLGYNEYQKQPFKIGINNKLATAMFYSLLEYMNQNDLSSYFARGRRINTNDMLELFGVNPVSVRKKEHINAYKSVFLKQGIPLTQILNDLGTSFLNNLGISKKKNTNEPYGLYEKLAISAGDHILELGRALGIFEISKLNIEDYASSAQAKEDFPFKKDIWLLKVPTSKIKQFKAMRDTYRDILRDRFTTKVQRDSIVRKDTKEQSSEERYVHRSDDQFIIPKDQQETIKRLENSPHVFNPVLLEFFSKQRSDSKNNLRAFLEANNDSIMNAEAVNNAALDEVETVEGRVKTVEAIQEGIEYAMHQIPNLDANKPYFYFDYMVTVNGRYMIKNSLINPQSVKFHRYILPMKDTEETYDLNNKNHINHIIFATAQAFDKLGESFGEQIAAYEFLASKSSKEIMKLMEDCTNDSMENVLAREENQYHYTVVEDGVEKTETGNLEVEDSAQALVALAHFYNMAKAKEEGKSTFKSTLIVEDDATTSGYCMNFLNKPLLELAFTNKGLEENWYAKVGILVGDNITSDLDYISMSDLKKKEGFLDIYKSSAKELYKDNERRLGFLDWTGYKDKNGKRVSFNKHYKDARLAYEFLSPNQRKKVKDDYGIDNGKKIKNTNTKENIATNNNITKLAKDKVDFYNIMRSALPSAEVTVDEKTGKKKYKVSKALRTLLKPAVMVINYTAGEAGVSRKLAATIFTDNYKAVYSDIHLKSMSKEEVAEKHKITLDQVNTIEKTFQFLESKISSSKFQGKKLYEIFKHNNEDDIMLKVDGRNERLTDFFADVIATTYGRSAWNGINKFIGKYQTINDTMNELACIQYTGLREIWNSRNRELAEKYSERNKDGEIVNISIPQNEIENLKKELHILYPQADLYYEYENSPEWGNQVGFVNYERSGSRVTQASSFGVPTNKSEVASRKLKNGKYVINQSRILRPNIYSFAPTGKKGAVLPVHGTDASAMTVAMRIYHLLTGKEYMGVHDAYVTSALESSIVPKIANLATVFTNRDYSMYESMMNNTLNNLYKRIFQFDTRLQLKRTYNDNGKRKTKEGKKYDYISYNTPEGFQRLNELIINHTDPSIRNTKPINNLEDLNEFLKSSDIHTKTEVIISVYEDIINTNTEEGKTNYEILHCYEDKIPFIGQYDNSYVTNNNQRDLITILRKSADIAENVRKSRETLYSSPIQCSNVDGSNVFFNDERTVGMGSSVKVYPDQSLVSAMFSDPVLFQAWKDKLSTNETATKTALEELIKEFSPNSEHNAEYYLKLLKDSPNNMSERPILRGSTPFVKIPLQGRQIRLDRAANNLQARLEILEEARQFDEMKNPNESVSDEIYDDYVRLFKKADPAILDKIRIQTLDFERNAGEYDQLTKTITIAKDINSAHKDTVRNLSVYSTMPLTATYAHETCHAAMQFANDHKNQLGVREHFDHLIQLQGEIFKENIITEEDFMPKASTYDSSLEPEYRKQAKDYINYIFSNGNYRQDEAINEFVAICTTHPKVMEKLKNTKSKMKSEESFLKRLKDLLYSILRAIFTTKGTFEDVSNSANNLFNNRKYKNNRSLYEDIRYLQERLIRANMKTDNIISNSIATCFTTITDALDNIKRSGNKLLINGFNNVFNFVRPVINTPLNPNAYNEASFMKKVAHRMYYNMSLELGRLPTGKWDTTKQTFKNIVYSILSKEARNILRLKLGIFNKFSHQSALNLIYNDVVLPDVSSRWLELMSLHTRTVDRNSKAIEAAVKMDFLEAFTEEDKKPINQRALTTSVLMTDLQCLLNNNASNISEIKEILRDNVKVEEAIQDAKSKIESIINKEYKTTKYKDKVKNYIINQATALGSYMATGIGNEMLNLNANNIAALNYVSDKGMLTGVDKLINNKELISSIDKLATLRAISFTSMDDRIRAAAISDNGFKTMIMSHRAFVKESNEGVQYITNQQSDVKNEIFKKQDDISNIQKGYVKHLLNWNNYIEYVPNTDKVTIDKLKSLGFTEIKDIDDKASGGTKVIMIRKNYAPMKTRDGSAVVTHGARTIGTAFDGEVALDNTGAKTLTTLYDVAKSRGSKIEDLMLKSNDDLKVLEEIKKISIGATPIARAVRFSGSKLTYDPTALDYRYTASHKFLESTLEMNMNASDVLAKMYASNNTKAEAEIKNLQLVKFLRTVQKSYMDKSSKLLIDQDGKVVRFPKPVKFIKIEPNSDNKFLNKAYPLIPQEIRSAAYKESLYVREDWLTSLCGVPSVSAGDMFESKNQGDRFDKYKNLKIRNAIYILEHMLKLISAQAKKIFVVGYPKVWLYNIISNINHTMLLSSNPIKVLRMYMANMKSAIDYVDDQKKLNRIMYKKRIGTVTNEESKMINWLKNKLAMNPVAPLMESGMFTNIIEDLRTTDLEEVGRVYKSLDKVGLVDKFKRLPKWLQTGSSAVWKNFTLSNSSGLYRFMYGITQFSDFISKCVEYQILTDENYKIPVRDVDGTIKSYKKIPKKYLGVGSINPKWIKYENEVKSYVLDTFINYDKPQSKEEQYLNDIGVLMFSKFAKRVQRVIMRDLLTNPVGVMMGLFSQSFLINTEDLMEQNVLNKHWKALVHDPIDLAFTAGIPWGAQAMLGDIDLVPSIAKN